MAREQEDEEQKATAEEEQEALKSALWYAIGRTVDSEMLRLGSLHRSDLNASPQFIGALTELVWGHAGSVAKDLESFARHANRTTVQTQDVLLLARRNESLETLLRRRVDELGRRENKSGG